MRPSRKWGSDSGSSDFAGTGRRCNPGTGVSGSRTRLRLPHSGDPRCGQLPAREAADPAKLPVRSTRRSAINGQPAWEMSHEGSKPDPDYALELIRFCGHPDTVVRRCSDVEETTAVRAGVPAPVRRAGFAVELFRAGRTVKELAREFECSASAIRNWVRQADRDQGRREDGLTSSDLEELRRLRRELRRVREERDILAKATAWFARETGSVPGRSSGS